MRVTSFVVWVWAFGIFPAAGRQSTSYGELFGAVRDSQGLLVPGASVSVSGANVLGARATVTDRHGSYHFRALFPGELSLTVTMDGFETVERGGIIVRTGATVVVDITLQPAGIAEQVTVTAAQIDRRTTRVGVSYEGEVVNAVPSSTDLWGVLAQSPGIRMRGYDVGGSHKATQTRYETFGIRGQNRIVSDGVDSTEGHEGAGLYYDFYSVEEFQVSTAGADVEMTSPGVSMVMTVKSGGDELSGLLNLDYEGSGMVGDNNSPELEARGFTGNRNLLFWEAHADLGGPIVERRAWFYLAYNHFRLDRKVSGVEPDVASDDSSFNNFTGKLTFALSPRDRLIGYSQWSRKERRHLGVSSRLPPESTRDQDGWGWEHKLEWQRSWSERAFGTVKLAHFGYRFDFTPNSDPETRPYRFDRGTTTISGSNGGLLIQRFKPQVSAQLSYYLPASGGNHDFKLGAAWIYDKREDDTRLGSVRYQDNSRLGRPHDVDDIQFINTPWVKDIIDEHIDFFLQDRWTLSNRLTLTLGARFSYQNVFYNDATNNPEFTEIFTPRDLPGETLQTWFNVAPRLGAAFDVTGTGRTVAKAYFGRFYVNLADTLRGAHPVTNGSRFFDFLDPNENGRYDGPEELGQLFFASDAEPNIVNELDHSYADELSFSLEHELDRDSAVRFSYVHKTLTNDFGFWDPAQGIPLLEAGVPCGDAIFSCPPHPFTGETLPLLRLPEPLFDVQDWRVENFPDSDYSYDTVQLVYSVRPSTRIWVRANFDYQWRDELRRNIVTGSPLESDPIGIAYFQNHHAEVGNRQTSANWQLRLLGQVRLPSQAAVSVNFRHQSGWPWAPIHGESIPGSGFQRFFLEDLNNNRSENVYLLDVRAEKSFLVGERHRVSAMVDVFNLLNSNAETNFVHRTGGRFLDLIAALDPITMKIGVRWQF